jgi:flavodoxin
MIKKMNTIVIYYTIFGNNRRIAEEIAEKDGYDSMEFSPGGLFRVFQFFFCKNKLANKAKKINANITNYDELIICGPIWANKPAPAIKALLENLDMKGKNVSCYMTYTKDYGGSEGILKYWIQQNSGEVKEIKFNLISKESK